MARGPTPGRQPGLSRDAILDRALAIADADGIDAVSVRRLARELGVTPMALYWHFAGKEALLHALGDRLLGGLDLTWTSGRPGRSSFGGSWCRSPPCCGHTPPPRC